MDLQKKILQDYRTLYPNESLREISSKTGIQLTRVFRLFNGSSMKLAEYQTFHQLIEQVDLERPELVSLIKECEVKLSSKAINEVESLMKRKLALWKLLNVQNDQAAAVAA